MQKINLQANLIEKVLQQKGKGGRPQSVGGGGEGIVFLAGKRVIPTDMAVVQFHRHIGGQSDQRQKCCEQHNDGKQYSCYSFCFEGSGLRTYSWTP